MFLNKDLFSASSCVLCKIALSCLFSLWYISYETLQHSGSIKFFTTLFVPLRFFLLPFPTLFSFVFLFVFLTMTTRAASATEFKRVIQTILGYNDTSNIWLALKDDLGTDDFIDFCSLTDESIEKAVNPGTAAATASAPAVQVPLTKKEIRMLQCLLKYGQYHSLLRTDGKADWSLLDHTDKWDDFLATVVPLIHSLGSVSSAAKEAISAAMNATSSSLSNIKADVSSYPQLTDWLQYRRSLSAIGTTQGVQEVFVDYQTDPRASLQAGSIQLQEFNNKSCFVYAVFSRTINLLCWGALKTNLTSRSLRF